MTTIDRRIFTLNWAADIQTSSYHPIFRASFLLSPTQPSERPTIDDLVSHAENTASTIISGNPTETKLTNMSPWKKDWALMEDRTLLAMLPDDPATYRGGTGGGFYQPYVSQSWTGLVSLQETVEGTYDMNPDQTLNESGQVVSLEEWMARQKK
ncbi:hypothetical protein TREMEDRAFT_63550 [Tremella mesenterica DSM 1558]|uniref:uncharacterized protein n=1 Tax=Tremella mesenterica (strain ATCC 24925 / CBS 8224 / DSM 1558 / NBRC 9311 / NRRL Y-6157 / RJB 2259-6 / UBC 559-6) TaxID=578456 RepID=UPI0003F4A04A|nr:uncharacterized protein TREMEDRAFT_63550 [Tremella mesenterica DSM 1558]EIW68382.1 hypothetical protein TREMEDRAFT_63550 [Tremella mesenterica DSM 1558]